MPILQFSTLIALIKFLDANKGRPFQLFDFPPPVDLCDIDSDNYSYRIKCNDADLDPDVAILVAVVVSEGLVLSCYEGLVGLLS